MKKWNWIRPNPYFKHSDDTNLQASESLGWQSMMSRSCGSRRSHTLPRPRVFGMWIWMNLIQFILHYHINRQQIALCCRMYHSFVRLSVFCPSNLHAKWFKLGRPFLRDMLAFTLFLFISNRYIQNLRVLRPILSGSLEGPIGPRDPVGTKKTCPILSRNHLF